MAGGGPAAAAHMFDPATNTWSAIGAIDGAHSSDPPRCWRMAGCLVVTNDASGRPGAVLYDPAAGN